MTSVSNNNNNTFNPIKANWLAFRSLPGYRQVLFGLLVPGLPAATGFVADELLPNDLGGRTALTLTLFISLAAAIISFSGGWFVIRKVRSTKNSNEKDDSYIKLNRGSERSINVGPNALSQEGRIVALEKKVERLEAYRAAQEKIKQDPKKQK